MPNPRSSQIRNRRGFRNDSSNGESDRIIYNNDRVPKRRDGTNSQHKRKWNNTANNRYAEVMRYQNGTLKILNARGTSTSDIIFPGESEGRTSQLYDPKRRPCPGNKPFCEDIDFDLNIAQFKNDLNGLKGFFGVDVLVEEKDVEIGQRIDYELPTLCTPLVKIVYPKSAENKDKNWLYIVNDKNLFKQGVRFESCVQEGSQCEHSENFPAHIRTKCVQKYMYRKMVAIDAENKTVTDDFKIPSCCACALEYADRSIRSLKSLTSRMSPALTGRRKRYKKFE